MDGMYFGSSKKPECAVIYARRDPDVDLPGIEEIRETVCRNYCEKAGIPVLLTVRVCCGSEDSLALLRRLLRSLPPEVDAILTDEFLAYSRDLRELGLVGLLFQCRKIRLCSLDVPGNLIWSLNVLTERDRLEAPARYLEAIR